MTFKKDILGARKLLFIEGTERNLISRFIVCVQTSLSLLNQVVAMSNMPFLASETQGSSLASCFWYYYNDRRTEADINRLKAKIYARCFQSSLSSDVQRLVAQRHAVVTGNNASTHIANAKTAALEAIAMFSLSERTAEKAIREFFRHLPKKKLPLGHR